MTTFNTNFRPWRQDGTVLAGASAVVLLQDLHMRSGIQVSPGGGGTVTVQFTMDTPDAVAAGTAVWINSSIVTSASAAQIWFDCVTAVKITAATQPATYHVIQ